MTMKIDPGDFTPFKDDSYYLSNMRHRLFTSHGGWKKLETLTPTGC